MLPYFSKIRKNNKRELLLLQFYLFPEIDTKKSGEMQCSGISCLPFMPSGGPMHTPEGNVCERKRGSGQKRGKEEENVEEMCLFCRLCVTRDGEGRTTNLGPGICRFLNILFAFFPLECKKTWRIYVRSLGGCSCDRARDRLHPHVSNQSGLHAAAEEEKGEGDRWA